MISNFIIFYKNKELEEVPQKHLYPNDYYFIIKFVQKVAEMFFSIFYYFFHSVHFEDQLMKMIQYLF